MRRKVKLDMSSLFCYTSFKQCSRHTWIGRDRWDYLRTKWIVSVFYMPVYDKEWEVSWHRRIYVYDTRKEKKKINKDLYHDII